MTKLTPMMAQWHTCKKDAQDKLLLFRMGDFYEAFYEDAKTLANQLQLTLTQRQGIPMAGIPQHALENYVEKLLDQGHQLAIAEQLEDPKDVKGLVKRGITRIVSPGTVTESDLLEKKSNTYFASIAAVGKKYGLAKVDISCGIFTCSEYDDVSQLLSEIELIHPKEILAQKKLLSHLESFQGLIHEGKQHTLTPAQAYTLLTKHLQVHNLDGFGLQEKPAAIMAASRLLEMLKTEHRLNLSHLNAIEFETPEGILRIDATTEQDLELFKSRSTTSLFQLIDHTQTGMGGRLLKHWLTKPTTRTSLIEQRLDDLSLLFEDSQTHTKLLKLLHQFHDLERLASKIFTNSLLPKQVHQIGISLEILNQILDLLKPYPTLTEGMERLEPLRDKILQTIRPEKLGEGRTIQPHVNEELDHYRDLVENGKQRLDAYQEKLKEETGIKNLKILYHKSFGYLIEVSRGQAQYAPDTFIRKQTLVNQERFVTDELKIFEAENAQAEEKILHLERTLFHSLLEDLHPYQKVLREQSQRVAHLDAISSLAAIARKERWVRPIVDDRLDLAIEGARHPVIESLIGSHAFVKNDIHITHDTSRLSVITGPNMAGKSTYIRQTALIVILAHIGSFVPCTQCHIGWTDQIFTRVGASDNLGRGQSTFMVEMAETARILHHATQRSLVILDEIGRGTSTYDGIAIAWSVAEYLLNAPGRQAKTLFATHYWELTTLANTYPGVQNLYTQVQENAGKLFFTHKMMHGCTDRSYGIHVAKLAGIPDHVVDRAHEILQHLELTSNRHSLFEAPQPVKPPKRKNPNQLELAFHE